MNPPKAPPSSPVFKIGESLELKLIYKEIIDGCSSSPHGFFVKHLSELEQIEIEKQKLYLAQKYIQEGTPTEAERMNVLLASEDWSQSLEDDIVAYRQTIQDNERLVPTIKIPQQQDAIRGIISQHREKLTQILLERHMKLGVTVEMLIARETNNLTLFLTLFKNRDCSDKLFACIEDIDNLEDEKVAFYHEAVDEVIGRISDLSVQKIAALPFFLNLFSYSKEAIHTFLQKPICQLTNYQIALFSLGTRNLNILAKAEGHPPDYTDTTTALDILKWYDTQYSILLTKSKKED